MSPTQTLQALLAPTKTPIARITPSSRSTISASPLASGALTRPYWEKDAPLPRTQDGEPMQLLCQLNFAELPASVDPDFPSSGILQLFISVAQEANYEILWSAGEPFAQGPGHQARFWPNPQLSRHDEALSELLQAKPEEHPEAFPGATPFLFDFSLSEQLLLSTDEAQASSRYAKLRERINSDSQLLDAWYDLLPNTASHQVGGYAYFTQSDPREPSEDWALLWQIDTDDAINWMWGDAGVGSLSIPRSALIARDFSQALYTWDCC